MNANAYITQLIAQDRINELQREATQRRLAHASGPKRSWASGARLQIRQFVTRVARTTSRPVITHAAD